jgi:hypothetical protein
MVNFTNKNNPHTFARVLKEIQAKHMEKLKGLAENKADLDT